MYNKLYKKYILNYCYKIFIKKLNIINLFWAENFFYFLTLFKKIKHQKSINFIDYLNLFFNLKIKLWKSLQ